MNESKNQAQCHSARKVGGAVMSYVDVADLLGISATRVAEIEREAFKKLRKSKYLQVEE